MRYWLLIVTVLVAYPGAANTDDFDKSAEDAVAAANKERMRVFNGRDPGDLSEFYTKDAAVFPPDMERVDGRENIARMWQSLMDLGITDLKLETGEVEADGNIAYEVGVLTYTAPDNEGETKDFTGKYLVVWVRRDGTWKLYRDIWNADPVK